MGLRGHRQGAARLLRCSALSSMPALEPPPRSLLERDTVLHRLQEAFAQTRVGMRQVVFVTGEPGIGKTTELPPRPAVSDRKRQVSAWQVVSALRHGLCRGTNHLAPHGAGILRAIEKCGTGGSPCAVAWSG
jgi:hypothetical protein